MFGNAFNSDNKRDSKRPQRHSKLLLTLLTSSVLAACASTAGFTDYNKDVVKKANEARKGPQEGPQRNLTSFAPALRCMDFLFLNYGVRDLGVLIEDIPDRTRKVNVGGKDMIISAVSEMTRRSRGISLVAFSVRDSTLGAVIGFGTRDRVIENTPPFTIRGSISQFDDSIVKKQGDAGIQLGVVGIGAAKQGSGSVLALDLSVIDTEALTLVPGVTSKNSVLVLKEGSGADGEVTTRKFGVNFSFVLSRSEGTAQAMRTLAELAIIELFGKLTKIPYWTCIGATDKDETVLTEVTDWWETLAADPVSLVAYFQLQMRTRKLYKGEITGEVDDSLLHSIAIYQEAMGRDPSPTLDFDFFKTYLATDHAATQKIAINLLSENPGPAAPVAAAEAAPAAAAKAAEPDAPFVYVGSAQGRNTVHAPGQAFHIDVAVDKTTNLYCFLLDDKRQVNQFFPNPANPSPAIEAGTRLKFPGSLPFSFVASRTGAKESIACYGSPKSLGDNPLSGLPVAATTAEITQAFRNLSGPGTGVGVYDVNVQ